MSPAANSQPDLSSIAEGLRPLAVPLDQLHRMARNPHHADLDALERSWARFGQRRPIVARRREDGGGDVIAGSHGLEIARRLKWSHVAVLWVDDDDATAKAFAVTDNHTAQLGHDDPELLSDLLMEVRLSDRELFRDTSYTDGDLVELLGDLEEQTGDGAPDPRRGNEQTIESTWAVVVECEDEATQMELLDRLTDEGHQCRALIS